MMLWPLFHISAISSTHAVTDTMMFSGPQRQIQVFHKVHTLAVLIGFRTLDICFVLTMYLFNFP